MSTRKTKRKAPNLCSAKLLRMLYNVYGKRHFSKVAQLNIVGDINNLPIPCIVVANHASFADVGGVAMLFQMRNTPVAPSFIASQTQYAHFGNVLNKLGVLPKKQFTVDTSLVRDIKYVLDKGRPLVLYPEAKLSVTGKPNPIKKGIAKLVKLLKAPLVTVRFDGSYLYQPRWAKDKRSVPITVTVKRAVELDEIAALSVDDIYKRILDNLDYNDYKYQQDNKIKVTSPTLVEGLHSLLYTCPVCGTKYVMRSHGNTLSCAACGTTCQMDEYGKLHGNKFDSVPQWYEWQCAELYQKVKQGSFCHSAQCAVTVLKNNKFVTCGKGILTLDDSGLTLSHNDQKVVYKRGMFYTLSFDGNAIYLPSENTVYKLLFPDTGLTTVFNIGVEQYAKIDEDAIEQNV